MKKLLCGVSCTVQKDQAGRWKVFIDEGDATLEPGPIIWNCPRRWYALQLAQWVINLRLEGITPKYGANHTINVWPWWEEEDQ